MSDNASYWLFTLPNFVLAAALYTLIGRYVLSLIFKPDSDVVLFKVFNQITNPILKAVRSITPAMVPNGLVLVFSIFWLIMLRILLLIAAFMFGFAPSVGG